MLKVILILFQLTPQFLLMESIEKSVKAGDFSNFWQICHKKISVYLEHPFTFYGYYSIPEFIDKFTASYSQYETKRTEWSSHLIGEHYAIQSLNLLLKNRISEQVIAYKFIFFMNREIVNIIKFDGKNSQIVFETDPAWEIGGEFEVSGNPYSGNQGRFRIVAKRGATYEVLKITAPLIFETDKRPGFKAKAWKLYYLKGLEI